MDEIEMGATRWSQFQHGANALMGFIQASIPDQQAQVDFRTKSGWDGDNIATLAVINVWDTKALVERGIIQWLQSLGWEREVDAQDNSETWTFLLQLEPDPYK